MAMILSINKNMGLNSDFARQSLSKLSKGFDQFVDDHHKAIEEIKKLSDDAPIQNMMRVVHSTLPDVDPANIVKAGIMQHSGSPYKAYLEGKSTDWNKSIGGILAEKYKPMYVESQQEFLNEQQLKGKIGMYHFILKDLNYTVDGATPTQISMNHKNEMVPNVVLFNDKSIHAVDEDEVGLEGFKNEISGPYIKNNIHDMDKHFDFEYEKVMDWYVPGHHIPTINLLSDYLGSFG